MTIADNLALAIRDEVAFNALVKQAQMARQKSERLLEEARNLRDNSIPELDWDLAKKQYLLDNIADDIGNGRRNLELINRALASLPRDLTGTLKDADEIVDVSSLPPG